MAITKKASNYTLSLNIPTEIRGELRNELLDELSEYLLSEIIINVEAGHSHSSSSSFLNSPFISVGIFKESV